ncbi:hypothetical protein [Ekhidna sp.]|uniref:hypothetical protein n=1 Tax=Ekhidna sp. TaxID=2608089 RepID=UPI003C79EE0E
MKYIIIVVLTLLVFAAFSQSLSEIRSEFHLVVLNPDDSRNFHDFVSEIENPSPTVQAYQAVSEALLAQVVWNPFNKLKQVIKYNDQMKEVIEMDSHNVEIRFLRLAIEYNLPSFLGMSIHMEEDVRKIVSNLSNISRMQVSPHFGKYIFGFLEQTDLCSPSQLAQMKRSFDRGVVTAGAE